jgi:hypothetical protein
MDIYLENACNGKAKSAGGLNIPEFKSALIRMFPTQRSRIETAPSRSALHDLCKELRSHSSVKPTSPIKQKTTHQMTSETDRTNPQPSPKPASPIKPAPMTNTKSSPIKPKATDTIAKDVANHRLLNDDECYDWIKCGDKVPLEDMDVWKIPKNTVFYKGIITFREGEENPYISDPNFLPEDFTYLAGQLATASGYAYDNQGRIITFITTKPIMLLDFTSDRTLDYVYNNCIACQPYLRSAFGLTQDRKRKWTLGRRSSVRDNDYALVTELRKVFPNLSGYAYTPVNDSKFHEEVVLFDPKNILAVYPIEYRWSGIMYGDDETIRVAPYMLKVINGEIVNVFLAPQITYPYKANNENLMYDILPRPYIGPERYRPYEIRSHDIRDAFFYKTGRTSKEYLAAIERIVRADPNYIEKFKQDIEEGNKPILIKTQYFSEFA